MDELKPRQHASFWYAMRAVIWSFFGLRRKSDFDTDSLKLNPLHIVIAAVIGAACFIALLVTAVHFAVQSF